MPLGKFHTRFVTERSKRRGGVSRSLLPNPQLATDSKVDLPYPSPLLLDASIKSVDLDQCDVYAEFFERRNC